LKLPLFPMALYWLFILFVSIQCRYVLYTFTRIFSLKEGEKLPVNERKPVSIIICAKNEAANLRRNLPAILSQRYSNGAGIELYEVIVVNDNSTDDTAQVLLNIQQQYQHLKIVNSGVPVSGRKGKKHAISAGVAHARHNWLLLTDADCMPTSGEWLELMVAPLADGKEIVAGYGGYYPGKGLLNAFIRWETLHTFIQYSSYALGGKPYMAVGRNLACTKDVLQKAQQSAKWNVLPSGDDDLLVSVAGTSDNTAIVCDPKAFTHSATKATWGEWVKQKQRHLSTGKYYKAPVKFSLAIYAISHTASWLLFFILVFSHNRMVSYVSVYMAFRCLLYWIVWVGAARKLHEKKLVYLFPLFDLGWMLYNFAFFPYISYKNKKSWT